LLIHVLDVSAPDRDPEKDFAVLNRELALYRQDLAERVQIAALNKIDLRPPQEKMDRVTGVLRGQGYEVFPISAVTGEGVEELMGRAARLLEDVGPALPETEGDEAEMPEMSSAPLRVVRVGDGAFEVSGDEVERITVMTDLDNEEAVRYLHRRLERMGVIRRLHKLGARDGDHVRIGSVELDYVE